MLQIYARQIENTGRDANPQARDQPRQCQRERRKSIEKIMQATSCACSPSTRGSGLNTAPSHSICTVMMLIPRYALEHAASNVHSHPPSERPLKMTSPTAPQRFATCDLCDTHKNDSSGRFRVLPPVFKSFGGVSIFCGPVVTVKCFEDNSLVKAAVDGSGLVETAAGRMPAVLVVDGGASLRRALLGGNLGAAAVRNGWAGVVIDGCVRDMAELAQCQLGIRALAAMPLPTEKRNQGQAGVAVQIQGVWVYPGDWLYADEDGMVVIPVPLQA